MPNTGLTLTAAPSQHFSGRGLTDRNRTLWCGYLITGSHGSVYFAGDTGYGPHLEEVRGWCPRLRLAMLPIGAYLPRWFMSPVHMSPEEAVKAHRLLGAGASMAMHFGTFPLGDDGEWEGPDDLRRALAGAGVPEAEFRIPRFGQPLTF